MLTQAPLSASPDLHAGIQSRLEAVVQLACEVVGDRLRSVVLGGSLARGRAFGVEESGELRLLSDLDLYVVADDGTDARVLRRRISDWARSDAFLTAPPDVAVVGPDYFGDDRDAMPTHQLAHGHRVLWGEAVDISGARDSGGQARVDPEDAARLLFNRCVEALDPALSDPDSLTALVHRTKQFIDAPMAWLAARGRYNPDRREQLREFTELGRQWRSAAGERLDGALEHWAACLDARDAGVIGRARLERLAGRSGGALPGGASWMDWTGGFARSLFSGGDEAALWETLDGGLDRTALKTASVSWLKRESALVRLRRSRRWCSVAPPTVSPWWRHAIGGSGPDRIFAAAVLRLHGVEDWTQPLAGLGRGWSVQKPDQLHALWWRWIQGRDDET
jgi:predicted nucleotidyltransferase